MINKTVYNAIEHIASYSVLLPILISVIRIKALNKTLWALFFYLILCLVVDQYYLSLLPDQGKANRLINCWTVFEGFILCLLFFFEAQKRILKILIVLLCSIFLIISLIIFSADLSVDDKIVTPIEAGILIFLCVTFFIFGIFDNNLVRPFAQYFFWIEWGLLMYASATILIFIENDYLIYLSEHDPDKGRIIWGIHDAFAILSNIFIAVGLWQVKHNRTVPLSSEA